MAKIIVYLGSQECNALQQLAQREMRVPRAQAALIIREELMRQGMLAEHTQPQEFTSSQQKPSGGQA